MAPVDIILSPTNVVQPDIVFLSRERFGIGDGSQPIRGIPDLVVEILSPSNRQHDLVRKRDLYARFGAPACWFVDLEAFSVTVLAHRAGCYDPLAQTPGIAHSRLLPDFSIDLAALFAPVR